MLRVLWSPLGSMASKQASHFIVFSTKWTPSAPRMGRTGWCGSAFCLYKCFCPNATIGRMERHWPVPPVSVQFFSRSSGPIETIMRHGTAIKAAHISESAETCTGIGPISRQRACKSYCIPSDKLNTLFAGVSQMQTHDLGTHYWWATHTNILAATFPRGLVAHSHLSSDKFSPQPRCLGH